MKFGHAPAVAGLMQFALSAQATAAPVRTYSPAARLEPLQCQLNRDAAGSRPGELRVHVINPSTVRMVVDFDVQATSNDNLSQRYNRQGARIIPPGSDVYFDFPAFTQSPVGGERTVDRCLLSNIHACPADPPPGWPKATYFSPFTSGKRCMTLADVDVKAAERIASPLTHQCAYGAFEWIVHEGTAKFTNKCGQAVTVYFYSKDGADVLGQLNVPANVVDSAHPEISWHDWATNYGAQIVCPIGLKPRSLTASAIRAAGCDDPYGEVQN